MNGYKSYMERQNLSAETHTRLLYLQAERKAFPHRWAGFAAMAACAALIVGVGIWGLRSTPGTVPNGSQSLTEPVVHEPEIPSDRSENNAGAADNYSFIVSGPSDTGKRMFPMVPSIDYPETANSLSADAARIYMPGSFWVDLKKADIQTIFWGPEGKPEAEHFKMEQGDLPWMLFWDGYEVRGSAWYDGQGKLVEATIWGELDQNSFTLRLSPGSVPFDCVVNPDRTVSDVLGVPVSGWSQVYDRDGDGQDDFICASKFTTENGIGVRFENCNSTMQAEYRDNGDMTLGGAQVFNTLLVRQALTAGLYLDHLSTAETIPAWREETFDSLEQARLESGFTFYLPEEAPAGYGEFSGHLSYQEDTSNTLWVRWSKAGTYDDVEVAVYLDGYASYALVDPDQPESYDERLYEIPWCDSVPEEYRETVDCPAFRAEDMSPDIVEARCHEKDTGGLTFRFEVLHPDGTLVSYHCDGLSAQQVWALVSPTLQ